MKSYSERKAEATNKAHKKIWKALRIENAVKVHGFAAVKASLNKWVNYQRENAKLLKEKRELEKKLAEVEKKL